MFRGSGSTGSSSQDGSGFCGFYPFHGYAHRLGDAPSTQATEEVDLTNDKDSQETLPMDSLSHLTQETTETTTGAEHTLETLFQRVDDVQNKCHSWLDTMSDLEKTQSMKADILAIVSETDSLQNKLNTSLEWLDYGQSPPDDMLQHIALLETRLEKLEHDVQPLALTFFKRSRATVDLEDLVDGESPPKRFRAT